MTKNPLLADSGGLAGDRPSRGLDEEGLRQWAAKQNQWAQSMGFDWWYRVVHRDQGLFKIAEVEKLEGVRAIDERARVKGLEPKNFRTDGPEADEVHAQIADLIRKNPRMTQDEFNRMVDRRKH